MGSTLNGCWKSRSIRAWVSLAPVVVTLSLGVRGASAAVLAVGYDSQNSPVYRINEQDGSSEVLGLAGYSLNSLTRGADHTYYSIAPLPNASLLVKLDTETGAASAVASFDFTGVRALASGPSGLLYGTLANGQLISIDPIAGSSAAVLQTPFYNLQGLTLSPNGLLYAWDGSAGLVLLDLANQTASDVNPSVGGTPAIQTIYFTHTGALVGARKSLFNIDLVTGETTELVGLGPLDIRGAEVVPEPGSLLLAGSAAGLMLARGRRPRRASFRRVARH